MDHGTSSAAPAQQIPLRRPPGGRVTSSAASAYQPPFKRPPCTPPPPAPPHVVLARYNNPPVKQPPVAPPPLSRGYTRAADYFFDSDDEAVMPKPHPVTPPAPHVGGKPTQPPLRQSSAESARSDGSARSARSAPMAKAARIDQSIRTPRAGHTYKLQGPYWTTTTTGCISPKAEAGEGVQQGAAPHKTLK